MIKKTCATLIKYFSIVLVITIGFSLVNLANAQTTTVAPNAPTNLVASSDDAQVTLNWNAPVSGAPVTRYLVEVYFGSSPNVLWASYATTARTVTFLGLKNGTSYIFKVYSKNISVPSLNAAGPVSATPNSTANPSPVVTITANPTTVTPGSSSNISWNSTGATSCVITKAGETGNWKTGLSGSNVSSGALQTNTMFIVRCVGGGSNPGTASVNVGVDAGSTVPNTPTNLVAVAGDASVRLSWNAPTGSYSGYYIEQRSDVERAPWIRSWDTWKSITTNSYTVKNSDIVNGKKTEFRVSAMNGNITGQPSNIASAVPTAGAGSTTAVPNAPTGLVATSTVSGQVKLDWTAPVGGGPVTRYLVEVYFASTPSIPRDTLWASYVATTNTLTLAGFKPGTAYKFKVYAKNNDLQSLTAAGPVSFTVPVIVTENNQTKKTGFTAGLFNSILNLFGSN